MWVRISLLSGRVSEFEHSKSTSCQYALRERALTLGWAEERILVIDQHLGHEASTTNRPGF